TEPVRILLEEGNAVEKGVCCVTVGAVAERLPRLPRSIRQPTPGSRLRGAQLAPSGLQIPDRRRRPSRPDQAACNGTGPEQPKPVEHRDRWGGAQLSPQWGKGSNPRLLRDRVRRIPARAVLGEEFYRGVAVSIAIRCPTCGQTIRAADDASGKRIKCPKCRAACLVPQVASAPLPVHKSSQRSEAPPEAEIRQCPFCSEKILATARKCKQCGEIIDPELKESRRRASGAQRPVVSALAVVRADPADREVARAIDRLAARKSLGLSIALTLLFGPLGLLYSTVDGGL